jgi:signal peptidase
MAGKIVRHVLILAVIIILSPIFASPVIALFIGGHLSIIMTGSMEPTIPVGSIVIIKKVNPEDIKVGDIITFKAGELTVMHRVIDKIVENNTYYFRTQGDANNVPDPWIVKPEDVYGALLLTIPFYGYLFHYAPISFTLFLLVSIIILIIRLEKGNRRGLKDD